MDTTKIPGREPSVNDVYQDDRNGDMLRVIYIDDQIAVLRGERTHHDSDNHVHRFDKRSGFEAQIESDRLTLQTDVDSDIPESVISESTNSEGGVTGSGEEDSDTDITQFTDGEGDDSSEDSVDESNTENGGSDEDVDEREVWKEVPYIGDEAMQNLYDNGFETVQDVKNATDDELIAVDIMGEGTVSGLREYVEDK